MHTVVLRSLLWKYLPPANGSLPSSRLKAMGVLPRSWRDLRAFPGLHSVGKSCSPHGGLDSSVTTAWPPCCRRITYLVLPIFELFIPVLALCSDGRKPSLPSTTVVRSSCRACHPGGSVSSFFARELVWACGSAGRRGTPVVGNPACGRHCAERLMTVPYALMLAHCWTRLPSFSSGRIVCLVPLSW